MKKRAMILLVLLAISIAAIAPVIAEEYVVRHGDCLWTIAQKPGVVSTWQEIAWLNGLEAPWTIHPGQRVRFVSETDILAARKWCQYMMPISSDENQRYFNSALKSLILPYNISHHPFRRYQPNGVHAKLIFSWVLAWRQAKKTGKGPRQGPGTRQIF